MTHTSPAPDQPTASDDAPPVAIGAWSTLGTPAAASVMAGLGADWLLLDAQHGLYDDRSVVDSLGVLAGTAQPGRTSPVLVRVPTLDAAWIGRALDAGASGVLVPLVDDEHEAAAAARACRYPPVGGRSRGSWAAVWGAAVPEPEQANRDVMCAVMVETPTALERVEAIARTPGVDMVFVGPFDLTLALGTDHASLLADRSPDGPLARVVRACRDAGVRAGAYAGDLESARTLRAHGFGWIATVTDAGLLASAGADLVRDARGDG
ncbi:aldolase/citrate lyase family protein [Cellulomonas sp. ATA003]|uniref:HpcH/HpaI aldolase family protein n=1 Tax=Cellulomonas sp. ATA003 TaxID=3073064 RepID=UPI002873166B|nr:aldolase/citrate lyase family protein [Cellulomonas sp. ATA003]WNB84573.1 aldolase/citrate lyase family protein [Cellulomonas sp. ATA003]